MSRLLIVGGGAGGPTAAARVRRLSEATEIIMFEKGKHVSYAHCGLPYFIGGVITDRDNMLISTPEKLRQRFNIETRTQSVVKAISPDAKYIEILDLVTNNSYRESYDYLLLSTGAFPIRPPLPGIDMDNIFTLRNLSDADAIIQFIAQRKPKNAVVIGAGFIGLEIAENLDRLNIATSIVEKADQVLSPLDPEIAGMLEHKLKSIGIKLLLSNAVSSFTKRDNKTIVHLEDGTAIDCDFVILSIGIKPNIELARSTGLEIGELGGISVNQYMQTSKPDIYAVGDAVETTSRITGQKLLVALAGPANRQAHIAADNICGKRIAYRGTLGTALLSLFDTTAATTGPNEKTLIQHDVPYEKCYIHPQSNADYYPGNFPITIKLLFSPSNGKILSAQLYGKNGVDKRLDVFATAITTGMTVDDLTQLELGYVPQYGSAKDAINMSGYVSTNIVNKDAPTVHWDEADLRQDTVILDVREHYEHKLETLDDVIHIPIDELRSNLEELPKDKPINIYCATGIRSYIAERILLQKGFNARNISGGLTLKRYIA